MNLRVLESYSAISWKTQSVPTPHSSSQEDDAKAQSITSDEGQPEWTQPPLASIMILMILESVHVL